MTAMIVDAHCHLWNIEGVATAAAELLLAGTALRLYDRVPTAMLGGGMWQH
jgi:hypothetical protein